MVNFCFQLRWFGYKLIDLWRARSSTIFIQLNKSVSESPISHLAFTAQTFINKIQFAYFDALLYILMLAVKVIVLLMKKTAHSHISILKSAIAKRGDISTTRSRAASSSLAQHISLLEIFERNMRTAKVCWSVIK